MTPDEYSALPGVNFSTLKYMDKSPAHYLYALKNPKADTAAMRLGRAVHMAILEPERFELEAARYDGDRRGKAWTEFQAAHEGLEILRADEYDECLSMSRAVRGNPSANLLLTNLIDTEAPIQWTHQGLEGAIACKGRLDGVSIVDGRTIVDIKTTRDASLEGFCRLSFAARYHAQAAMYCDGYGDSGNGRPHYSIIAVESEPPYDVVVYRLPQTVIDAGRELYWLWLDRLQQCQRRGEWPGYARGEVELQLPRWGANNLSDIFEENAQ